MGTKVVDKAMSLPLVSSAYTEVTRVTSPYMESTMTRVSPVVEMVSPMVDSVKTRVEEQLMTHIPTNISETVQTVQAKAVDQVIAAVEKGDGNACSGIDQLAEKVPQLKDATPKLIEETKSSVTSFVTGWSEYFASFSMALVTLKVVDATLIKVETILKAAVQDTANTLRIGAVKRAGTPLAKKIEDGTVSDSLMEVSGLQSVLERLGLVSGEVPEVIKDVTEDVKIVKATEVIKDVTEDSKVKEETAQEKVAATPTEEPAVEKLIEEPVTTEEVTKKTSSKKSKKGSKEATPVGDLM